LFSIVMDFRRVYVKQVSLTTLQENGFDLGDNGGQQEDIYGHFDELTVISCLTNKQKKVVDLLSRGFKRKEIAQKLGISLQAVHQIIPRIRKRVLCHVGTN